jgi:hypothetical protein
VDIQEATDIMASNNKEDIEDTLLILLVSEEVKECVLNSDNLPIY